MPDRPKIICVTPVRNEAWTLDRLLAAASLWADHIVIGDQHSTDDTRAIAVRYPKVILAENHGEGYDEGERHRVILEAARTVPGPRAIFAIDADEALSADVLSSPEWAAALASPPGTIFHAEWVNVLPTWDRAWIPERIPVGFVDDGREHSPGRFHVRRILERDEDLRVDLDAVKVLHFQYTDWPRMKSKQRRYQAVELLAGLRPIPLYRRYHQMDALPAAQLRPLERSWVDGYAARGVDLRQSATSRTFWWDEEVLDLLLEHGPRTFRRIDLWDVDWYEIAGLVRRDAPAGSLDDPRGPVERAVMAWLAATQRRKPAGRRTRWVQRALIPFGW